MNYYKHFMDKYKLKFNEVYSIKYHNSHFEKIKFENDYYIKEYLEEDIGCASWRVNQNIWHDLFTGSAMIVEIEHEIKLQDIRVYTDELLTKLTLLKQIEGVKAEAFSDFKEIYELTEQIYKITEI